MITKQQWSGIESTIKSGARVAFEYQGNKVEVAKIQTDETHLAYIVVNNGEPLVGFYKEGHERYQPLSAIFLRKKQVNTTAKIARSIAKERGGKAWLRRRENRHYLEKDHEVTETFFPSARTVVNQFRKIEGLTLSVPLEIFPEGGDVPVRDEL
ncbi:hypothetical protein HA45_19420 [Pantoea rodasii]|uniref:hypothetical protein n=1 Tax=Pantoea rodasii TaxID=1076549 RepID=UPI000A22E31C|nr:hypothetical protein [Pantoea rodasii]ORM62003.1 hypothetical protein HA45_19420 [Pantoea rodasii]